MIARRLDMNEITQQLLDSGVKQHLVSNNYVGYQVCFYHNYFKQEAKGEQSAVTTAETETSSMEEEHEKALV